MSKILSEAMELVAKDQLTVSEAKRLLKLKRILGLHLKWPNHPQYETRYGS